MVHKITVEDFLRNNSPLIDVRSPGEFKKGHIPGAINIPLFTDAERAHIGTIYLQVSQEKATELAYHYVNPKLDDFIFQSNKAAPHGKVTIHCWRGGMRSQLFAEHLNNHDFSYISVIEGGYKAYRNVVIHAFERPLQLKIIGGYTGSGKTHIIKHLTKAGQQVIDLEELAGHKGSAFGHIGHDRQPTSEQFENDLFDIWRKLNSLKPLWLEDESRNIGGVNIPMPLYAQMLNSRLYFLDIPKEVRAKQLVKEYANAVPELLAEAINKLKKRLGGLNTTKALQFLNEKNYFAVAMLTLQYYDKSYLKGLNYRNQDKIITIKAIEIDPVKNAKTILKIDNSYGRS
jgi:tRNA 2-selenouridine synthase